VPRDYLGAGEAGLSRPAPCPSLDHGRRKAWTAEHDENKIRKHLTVTERSAIAQRMVEQLQGRVRNPSLRSNGRNIPAIAETGKTRDIAATRAGLGSGKTLEAAQRVVAQSGGGGISRKNLFSACAKTRKQKARSD
jgi:hypothetical protein